MKCRAAQRRSASLRETPRVAPRKLRDSRESQNGQTVGECRNAAGSWPSRVRKSKRSHSGRQSFYMENIFRNRRQTHQHQESMLLAAVGGQSGLPLLAALSVLTVVTRTGTRHPALLYRSAAWRPATATSLVGRPAYTKRQFDCSLICWWRLCTARAANSQQHSKATGL